MTISGVALLAICTLLVYDRSFDLMAFLMKGLARTDGGYVLYDEDAQVGDYTKDLPKIIKGENP